MAPLIELFESLDASNRRRRWQVYAIALVVGVALFVGGYIDSTMDPKPASQSNGASVCAS